MQSWTPQDQNAADGTGQWPTGFVYQGQNGQYSAGQHQWAQPGAPDFPQVGHGAQDASAADFHFDAAQQGAGAFLGDQHMTASQPGQPAFHGGHGSMHQQFASSGQDLLDPSFGNIHPNIFSQQQQQQQQQQAGKMGHGGPGGMGHMAMGQVQNHSHTHPEQAFAQHNFPYPSQGSQAFGSPGPQMAQYSPPQLMARPALGRQQSHAPVQQQKPPPPQQQQQQHYDVNANILPSLAQGPGFPRTTQASPVQQHAQQQLFSTPNQSFVPSATGQHSHYQAVPHGAINYQQFQDPASQPQLQQQGHFQQQGFSASAYKPQNHGVSAQQQQQQQSQQSQQQASTGPAPSQAAVPKADSGTPSTATESPAKKRKRVTKGAAEAAASESPTPPVTAPAATPSTAPAVIDLSAEPNAKKVEEIDSLTPPVPTAEEAKVIAESAKHVKAAHTKGPPAKAVPYLVGSGVVKLPAPKSFDKLSPMVALPSRSGRAAVSGLGYALPCEIQGLFTSRFKPAADKLGLDERRDEAKDILAEYDRSMKALGKRQPKYTEYPHSFKEQLKADEASKNKAEKKAKKEQEEERNKPARSATRPTELAAAAAWDIIGIVKIESPATPTGALIANRVKEAGEFLINLRSEVNRAIKAHDQAVKDKLSAAETAKLKGEADQKREALYRALDAALVHADDAVMDNLGGHQRLVLSLVNALIACSKANDFSGKLPKIVLEFFTHFKMTKKIADTPNFEMVRKRFEERGDSHVKDLLHEISDLMANLKPSESTTGYAGTSAAGRAKSVARPSAAAEASSSKRGRDEEEETRTVKKIAVEPGSSALSKKLGQSKNPASSSKSATSTGPKTSSILPGKSRPVAKPANKPEAPASADSPSASVEEKRPVAPKKEAKPTVAKAAAGGTSVVSSISSLLDSINSKKPEPQAAPVKEGATRSATPETAEQMTKRLRKEARRRLRVSWKPEGELAQIRVFEKDDEEDRGRDVNQLRDATDDRSEGMVLKRRVNVNVDDDDDDVPYHPWEAPTPVDFSHLPEEMRNKSYVTRGGSVKFTTEEQKRIAEREQRELMVIYTDPADIPESSKSPPSYDDSAMDVEPKVGQLPMNDGRFSELRRRWQDEEQMGVDLAFEAAMKRLDGKKSMPTRLDTILGRLHQPKAGGKGAASAGAQRGSGAGEAAPKAGNLNVPLAMGAAAEAHVFELLKRDWRRMWRDAKHVAPFDASRAYPYGSASMERAGKTVEGAVARLAGKAYPATAPPEWVMDDEEKVREWWLGHNKEAASRQKRQDEERARTEAQVEALRATLAAQQASGGAQDWGGAYYAQQQQAFAPYMALLQQMNGGGGGGGGQQAGALQPGGGQGAAAAIPERQLLSMLAAINGPPSQQQAAGPLGAEAQHDAEAERGDGGGRAGDQQQHDGDEGRGKKKRGLANHKPANKALIGTKPCTFWQQGKCARGDKCTFRHD